MIKEIANGMELAESPFWDNQNNIYYWVDILKKRLFSFKNNTIDYKEYDTYISFIFKNNKNQLCAAFEDGIYVLDNKYNKIKSYITFQNDGFRCNDGGISPNGELFIGRMNNLYNYHEKEPEYDGKLLLIKNGTQKEILKNVGISNGIAWHSKGNKVYFIDSLTKSVQEFDYVNSEFKNPKTVYKLENISPDGMSIDNKDRLWIAQYGEGKIVCIDTKTFDSIYEYNFDRKNITSCCFAGINLDEILITSAEDETKDGAVYLLKTENITGRNKNIYIE
ncbi:SMP-30/gluconolactonase/LRE family protein [Brachyspira pulli]|uniref:SMP-30/gluconolactonase/LRE family protein n=1 Tax=Brachyspira pulli TaxID=310721 RepID=UPI003003EA9D